MFEQFRFTTFYNPPTPIMHKDCNGGMGVDAALPSQSDNAVLSEARTVVDGLKRNSVRIRACMFVVSLLLVIEFRSNLVCIACSHACVSVCACVCVLSLIHI